MFVFLSPLNFSSYSRWKCHSFSCINTLDKWTAAPSPLGSCGEAGLKKLAPDHLSPGVSCWHSTGRKIFGLLNRFSASTASLARSLALSLSLFHSLALWKLVTLFQPDWGGFPRLGVGAVSPGAQGWMERGPSPLLSNCQDVPASPRTSTCLGIGQNTVRAHLGRQRFGKPGRGGGWLGRSPPSSGC